MSSKTPFHPIFQRLSLAMPPRLKRVPMLPEGSVTLGNAPVQGHLNFQMPDVNWQFPYCPFQ